MTDRADDGDATEGDGAAAADPDSDAGGDAEAESFPCPDCGESLPAGARFCPHCEAALSEDGAPVDLSELDGLFDGDDQPEFITVEGGERRASGTVMVIAGLAVSIPLAPLGLFLVNTVQPLTVWTAPLVFLGSWLGPAAFLARARVPAEAFARSLYFVAAGTALIPIGLRVSGNDLSVAFGTVMFVALVIAGLAVLLGMFMHRQASARITGERRAFEDARRD
ncbi:zinc ribbon domain-containing protein [Halosimplex salinum]|uniref:zinc ribbon domain-containing protein n=1 Tax=Halosimplex salinum TaxID=1710538 RepID=UPI000F497E4F|nr:zinc ribbon domain-containing protein [Halosimplex salinum]